MYKQSRYNVFFMRNNLNYIWNTLSGALSTIDEATREYLTSSDLPESFQYFNLLRKEGYIVPVHTDELGKILLAEEIALHNCSPEICSFVIAPGMGCNYDCEYCFEKQQRESISMDSNIQKAVITFIQNRIIGNPNCKKVHISWFGGEPLLYKTIILHISRAVSSFCEERNCQFTCSLITNGRFLTTEFIEEMEPFHLNHIQVTIDGTKDVYCRIKKADPDDFDAVIANVRKASERNNVSIRINTDLSNKKDIISITDQLLSGASQKISCYIAPIREEKEGIPTDDLGYSKCFLEFKEEYINHIEKNYDKSNVESDYPRRSKTPCGAVRYYNCCIDPNGMIYRCQNHVNIPGYAVGDVINGYYFNQIEQQFQHPFHSQKCLECVLFPICLGGCPDEQRVHYRDCDNKAVLEYNIRQLLRKANIQQQQQQTY